MPTRRGFPFVAVFVLLLGFVAVRVAGAQGSPPSTAGGGGGGAPQPLCPTCPIYAFGVNPDGVYTPTRSTSTTYVDTFSVINAGNQADSYTLFCGAATGLTCGSVVPSEVSLSPGDSALLQVTYTTGASATTGVLRVMGRSDFTDGTNQGSKHVPISVAPLYGLTLTRVSPTPLSRRPLATHIDTFTVTNVGTQADLYSFPTTCAGSGVTPCAWTATPSSQYLTPSQAIRVVVSYTTTATLGSGNTVTLRGTSTRVDVATAYTVTVELPPGPPAAVLANANGDHHDRSLCLTSGAGEAAAYQCGDLLVAHGMPGFATLGRDRALTLVYTSAQATPVVQAAAWVTLGGAQQAVPTQVSGEFQVWSGGSWVTLNSNTWPAWGSPTTPETRQLVLAANTPAAGSGVYAYRLLIRNVYPSGTHETVLSGTHLLVGRAQSEFGRGWWLAGVEQIRLDGDGHMLWFGGDGSAKRYLRIAPDVYVAPAGAFRDTIRLDYSTWNYVRRLRHGVTVAYSGWGDQVAVTNRAGQTTTFSWDTQHRLVSITVPPAGQPPTTYTITYDGTGKLDRITDPVGRVLEATVVSGQLTTLVDPDGAPTTFTYRASDGRMQTRTSPRTHGAVTFGYANDRRLTSVAVPRDSFVTDVTTFAPWDELGQAGTAAVPVTQVYTKVDGPRTGVADTAVFVLDRWGAPTRIVDPLAHVTTIERGDAAVPALVTRVSFPDGRIGRMRYNARGNLTELRDSTLHLANGQPTAVTRWTYTSPNTADSPDSLIDPEGVVSRYTYTPLGLTFQAIAPNGHVTEFDWQSSGPLAGVLQWVTERQVPAWDSAQRREPVGDVRTRFGYNALGNLIEDTSAMGRIRRFQRDLYQRVQHFYDAAGHKTEYAYDLMNRSLTTQQHVHVAGYAGFPADPGFTGPLLTRQHYLAGLVDSILDPRGVTRRYRYNAQGLVVTEWNDYGVAEHRYFNAAGLPDSVRTRWSDVIRHRYDAAGRKTQTAWAMRQNLPATQADSVRYTYDALGRTLTAQRTGHTITRTYYPTGQLRSEHDALANVTQTYGYDRAGRRTWYRIGPANTPTQRDSVAYRYDPATGALRAIWVRWRTVTGVPVREDSVRFRWDALGRQDTLVYSNGAIVRSMYDADGQLRALCGSHSHPTPDPDDVFKFRIVHDWVDRDGLIRKTNASGQPTTGTDLAVCPDNELAEINPSYTYDNRHQMTSHVEDGKSSTYQYDASGNRIAMTKGGGVTVSYQDSVEAGHNRLVQHRNVTLGDRRRYAYEPDGSRLGENPCTPPLDCGTLQVGYREYYYDGLGRMAGSYDLVCANETCTQRTLALTTNCGYDPLGRLVTPCETTAPRLAFDGDNVVRAGTSDASWTNWTFVHGPGVDNPLLGRYHSADIRAYFVTDGQGRQYAVGNAQGRDLRTNSEYQDKGGKYAGGTQNGASFGADRHGSANLSGLSFFRNRVYDQATGRWTQEDPLGVAGGLNLYQFNGNNPATFSDPFGLCPPEDPTTIEDCRADQKFIYMMAANGRGIQAAVNIHTAAVGTVLTGGAAAELLAGSGTVALGVARAAPIAAGAAGPSQRMLAAFQRQLSQHGVASLQRSAESISKELSKHLAKLAEVRTAGGHTSSIEREIRTFRRQLEAIRRVLEE